jgi:hypothetical protein
VPEKKADRSVAQCGERLQRGTERLYSAHSTRHMSEQLSSSYRAVVNDAQALLMRPVRYYAKDRPLNTVVIYGVIKAIVLLGAIGASLLYQPQALLQTPMFLAKTDGVWYTGIAYQGYAFSYPYSAPFPPLFPFLIKIFSVNIPALMPWVAVLLANSFSFLGLYFLYKLAPLVVDEKYRLRVCFAYMVFPVLTVCNLVSYTEPLFLAFTIGAYYFWKRSRFGFAALLAILSVFTRQVGAFILVIFLVDMLYGYVSGRERSRAVKQLAVIGATCAGVAMLGLFYYYTFGDPFAAARIQATLWHNSFSVTNLFENVRIYGFEGLSRVTLNYPLNYSAVPILLIDALLVAATALFLLKRDPALSAYALVLLVMFLSLSQIMSFVREVAAIFPLYFFLGFLLSVDWKKNGIIGVIALVVAVQNMFLWITIGEWLF